MFKSGEMPGAGSYQCRQCGEIVTLTEGQALPACPVCGNEEFDKI